MNKYQNYTNCRNFSLLLLLVVTSYCKAEGLDWEKPQSKDCVRILSIDGGGIRGLIPALILKYIVDEVHKKNHNSSDNSFYFATHLDLMSGSSTGGLITLALSLPGDKGKPKFTPEALVNFYKSKGPTIFPPVWDPLKKFVEANYNPANLEEELKCLFGDVNLSSCLCHTLITSYDLNNNCAHLFDTRKARFDKAQNFMVRDAARATSAAPTYFKSAQVKSETGESYNLVDGGVYANNPTLLALTLAQKMYPDAKEYLVISLGTGITKEKYSGLSNAGEIKWAENIADVLMGNMADYTDFIISDEACLDKRVNYIRIQTELDQSEKAMDNVSTVNIDHLIASTEKTIQKHEADLQYIVDQFVKDFEGQSKKA